MFELRKYIVKPAAAICLALGSTSAMAYLPVNNDDAAITLHWGGATASTLSAMELTVTAVCASNVHILYVPAGSGTNPKRPGNDWAVACTARNDLGLPVANSRVLVVKRDRGGSGVGVGPVQTKSGEAGSQITFLNVSPATCPTVGTPGVNGAPAITNPSGGLVPLQECAATYNQSRYTEMGTSDIEPNKFFLINEPVVDGVGLPFRPETDRAFQEETTLAGLAFNTPVTLALRNVLQTEQFPAATSVCNPAHPSYNLLTDDPTDRADATNAESQACMPSLSRSQIASMMAIGTTINWNQLLRANGTAILPAGLPIQVCRRVAGSGTQATINALIMGWPGDPGSTIDIQSPKLPNGTTIIGNSGSSDVDNCLHNFNATANPYAIGILSVEGRNTDNLRNWRYIKIDGVAPTLRNMHAGDTYMWAQQSCQRRNNGLPYNNSGSGQDTIANKALVYSALCGAAAANGLNNPVELAKLDDNAIYTWGRSGWLATPTATFVASTVLNYATPINLFTRNPSNRPLNILQVPLKATVGVNAGRGMIVVGPDQNP